MQRHSRRQLLQGSVALAVFTLLSRREVAGQQTAKIPRIGFLAVGSRQGLREHGYVEGQNIVIEYRFSEGRNDRLPAFPVE
jgi:putative ABC transport system substrate-binding protein